MILNVYIEGTPAPGGSKNAFPFRRPDGSLGARVADAGGKKTKTWRATVKASAIKEMNGRPPVERYPLALKVDFVLERPRGHFRTGKYRNLLKPNAPRHHIQKPDATKLLRALEDALTGVVWKDDAQIVNQRVKKRWVKPGHLPGAHVIVEVFEEGAL